MACPQHKLISHSSRTGKTKVQSRPFSFPVTAHFPGSSTVTTHGRRNRGPSVSSFRMAASSCLHQPWRSACQPLTGHQACRSPPCNLHLPSCPQPHCQVAIGCQCAPASGPLYGRALSSQKALSLGFAPQLCHPGETIPSWPSKDGGFVHLGAVFLIPAPLSPG